jgi:NADPH:quinone reductase-like Zn-dependent oxidoreductase
MKSVIATSAGADLKVVDTPIPTPEDDQILVKSIYAPVNPV